jgi:metal-sulfur cluster biosynthetic enzyme
MSIFDRLKELMKEPARPVALHHAEGPEGAVLDALREVMDPEAGLDIVTLGLVRRIVLDEDQVQVVMTLTTPGCPVAGRLFQEVEETLAAQGLYAEVELELDPPWSADEVAEEGRTQLG